MEYDLDNPASWFVHEEPPCDPAFDVGLLDIGGTNGDGDPMLKRVWGGKYRSKGILVFKLCDTDSVLVGHQFRDESGEMCEVVKLEDVPATAISIPIYRSEELGELRWIVLRWISPEDLKRLGYFDESLRHQGAESNMGAEAYQEFRARVAAGEDPEVAFVKVENQADRARPLVADEEIKTYFDPEWRKNGDYQFFFRLERADGTYHAADDEALEGIRLLWEQDQSTTVAEREALIQAEREQRARTVKARKGALWHPDSFTGQGVAA